MTYNFDPDKWFDIELSALELKNASGKIAEEEFLKLKDRLCIKYDEMVDRLNNTYQLPEAAVVKKKH